MMKKIFFNALLIGTLLAGIVSGANASNILLDTTVTFHGTNLYTDARNQADLSTLVDGVFRPESSTWDDGTVSWLYRTNAGSIYNTDGYIKFDLGGVFEIDSFTGQFDDNDAYKISYWDMTSDVWVTAWDVPNFDAGNWGMTTRPMYTLTSAITTNLLKLEGKLYPESDNNFSASEVQAFGVRVDESVVPEPGTILLLGFGLLGLAGVGRRKK